MTCKFYTIITIIRIDYNTTLTCNVSTCIAESTAIDSNLATLCVDTVVCRTFFAYYNIICTVLDNYITAVCPYCNPVSAFCSSVHSTVTLKSKSCTWPYFKAITC